MKIPEQVIAAAQELIDIYGSNIDYLGEYEGADYYIYHFPDEIIAGYPFVYRYSNGEVVTISGPETFSIIDLFLKNINEVDVE